MNLYQPEGALLDTPANRQSFQSLSALEEACAQGRILESRAIVCDSQHNLIVDMGPYRGIIPREECAMGIAEGTTRDIAIISRVNKPVCYRITGFSRSGNGVVIPQLSRRAVQQECMERYLGRLIPGDILPARVTHLEAFGCFVDVELRGSLPSFQSTLSPSPASVIPGPVPSWAGDFRCGESSGARGPHLP